MNKYFLPVYNSQLKPWIKWWILKRLGGGQSSLKAVTISSGTLTKVDKSMGLRIKEYYGNAIQNGTPTPDSPVPVQTISGNITFTINGGDYKLDLKSKQLFDKDNINKLNGYFESNNVITASDYNRIFYIECEPNTTYTIQQDPSASPINNHLLQVATSSVLPAIGVTCTSNYNIGGDTSYTMTTNSEAKYLVFRIRSGDDVEAYYSTIMINEGTTALPYESYYNYELCKIGDYKDKIVNDNGTWKIEKKVGKVVLNGTGTWTSSSAYTGYARFNCDALPETVTDNNGLNTHFIERVSQPHGGYDYLYISANSKKIYVQIQNSIASSVSGFTTWLSNNNVTVYYVKPTTATETITNTTLISELNALYEFYVNSSTVTISNNSEIPFEVLLEYYGR